MRARKSGVPTGAGKVNDRFQGLVFTARALKTRKCPTPNQGNRVAAEAFANLTEKYGDFPYHTTADSMDPWEMHQEVYALLDGGVGTTCAGFTDGGLFAFLKSLKVAGGTYMSWCKSGEKKHGNGKEIKIIMAPPMGHFPPIRQGFVHLLKDRLDTLSRDDKSQGGNLSTWHAVGEIST